MIIVVNKWDAVTGRTDGKVAGDRDIYEKQLRRAWYLDYAPVIFLSALEGMGMGVDARGAGTAAAERRKRVSTGQMNRFLSASISSVHRCRWPSEFASST